MPLKGSILKFQNPGIGQRFYELIERLSDGLGPKKEPKQIVGNFVVGINCPTFESDMQDPLVVREGGEI